MNTLALRYFIEVATSGSIAAASERLNVAGSAVSRQICTLENAIGLPLFVRLPRGMKLTWEGEQLAQHVRRSNLEEERVIAEIRNHGANPSGTVRIATSEGLAAYFLPALVHLYRQRFPDVHFDIRAESPSEIVSSIQAGSVDIGIGFGSGQHAGIKVVARSIMPTYALVSPNHPLAGSKGLRLKDIEGFPVASSRGTTARHMLDLRSVVEGVHLNVVYESNYSSSLFNYAKFGDAVSFAAMVSMGHWITRGDLVAIPLLPRDAYERSLDIQLMEGRIAPVFIRSWIEFLTRTLRDLDDNKSDIFRAGNSANSD